MASVYDPADNKRVAKNAMALTLRMVLVTIVGLYTSRIVLQALGVNDYGIYGVVGGVVGMTSFLNTSMAGATSRFITFELGKGNNNKLKNIFSTALIIHFIIALAVIILGETVGLWFLNHKMVIPEKRMIAANILYQFTIASVLVGFTQVPYAADIVAHEKMNIYAYFEIINVILKLTIVYFLLIVPGDRLIFYAAMVFIVSVLSAIFYRWYCIRHFPEARFSTHFDKSTAKSMLSFSAFDLYGNLCITFKYQGQPILLNLFFGVVANTAATITTTVNSVLTGLTINVFSAFRPQIIKNYALGLISEMQNKMEMAMQLTIFLFGLLAVPIILKTSIVLSLWLNQVPEYTVDFIRLVLLGNFLVIMVQVNTSAIHATGKIRAKSLLSGTFYLISLVLAYIFLKRGFAAYFVYIVDLFTMSCVVIIGLIIVRRQVEYFRLRLYIIKICRTIAPVVVTLVIGKIFLHFGEQLQFNSFGLWGEILNLGILTIITSISLTSLSFALTFDKTERALIINYIKNAKKRLTIRR